MRAAPLVSQGGGPAAWAALGASLSLSNLLYARVWVQLLPGSRLYLLGELPTPSAYLLAFLGMACLGLMLFQLLRATSGNGKRATAASWILVILVVASLNGLRSLAKPPSVWPYLWVVLLAVLFVGCALLLWHRRGVLVRAIRLFLLALLPFVAVTTWRCVGLASSSFFRGYDAPASRAGQAQAVGPHDLGRVVILIFDELDQQDLEGALERGASFPALTRLRDDSSWSDEAYAPTHRTLQSLPSYITGRLVTAAQASPFDLTLSFADGGPPNAWSRESSIFRRASEMGARSGLVGWFHPYCRVLGEQVDQCASYEYNPSAVPGTPTGQASWQAGLVLGALPGMIRLGLPQALGLLRTEDAPEAQVPAPSWHARQYANVLGRARTAVSDDHLDLVFVHFPIPHDPYIFDAATGQIATAGGRTYLDNLALVDETVATLRADLELKGVWNRTNLILTSDHWRRDLHRRMDAAFDQHGQTRSSHRVPFLVKLAGNELSSKLPGPVWTLMLHDLALALLHREIAGSEGLVKWTEDWAARPRVGTLGVK